MGSNSSHNSLPPGPPPRFLLGNLPDLDTEKLHHSFTEISKKYGDVFTVYVSGKTLVVINSLEAFRELIEDGKYDDSVSGREHDFVAVYIVEQKDLAHAPYTSGYRTRRATLYSSYLETPEDKIYNELTHAVEYVKSNGRAGFTMETAVKFYLASICTTSLRGERYEYDDECFRLIVERMDAMQALIPVNVSGLMTNFPFIRFLPGQYRNNYCKGREISERLKKLMFDPMKESYDPNNIRGGIDSLIRAQKEANEEMAKELTDTHLWESALSTIGAGTALGVGLISYFFVVILHHPEIAVNIRAEIEKVVGDDRLPTLEDRSALSYTEAALWELFRWVTPAPILLPRRLDSEISWRGYTLPKDTVLITNAWKFNHDEKMWENPWEFRPERFLDADGKIRDDLRKNVVVFGGGKRGCVGSALGFTGAFLFISAMVQRFDFEVPAGVDLPPLDPHLSSKSSAGIKPEPFQVTAKPKAGAPTA